MTLAELYTKLENLEGGKELIDGFKSEISRINEGAKATASNSRNRLPI